MSPLDASPALDSSLDGPYVAMFGGSVPSVVACGLAVRLHEDGVVIGPMGLHT